jgi:hypothetical protein
MSDFMAAYLFLRAAFVNHFLRTVHRQAKHSLLTSRGYSSRTIRVIGGSPRDTHPPGQELIMVRSALLVMLAVAVTAFMSACAYLFPLISPGENKAHKIANLWARMLLWLLTS